MKECGEELFMLCVDPGESRAVNARCGCFCFFLAGRRSPLARDAILSEPEVSLVRKFRFFRVNIYIYFFNILKPNSPHKYKYTRNVHCTH